VYRDSKQALGIVASRVFGKREWEYLFLAVNKAGEGEPNNRLMVVL